MRCDEVRRLLSAYYDKELSPDRMEAIREHLNYCMRSCNKNLDSIKKVHSLMDYFPILEVGPYFESELFQKLEEERIRGKRINFGLKLALSLTAGILVFFLALNNIWKSQDTISSPSLNTYVKEYVEFAGTHISRNNPGLVITVTDALGDLIK